MGAVIRPSWAVDGPRHSDTRPTAPKGTQAEISVYLGPILLLPPQPTMPLHPGVRTFVRMASGPTFVDVALSPDLPIGPWQHALVDVNVNGWLFGAAKPIAWWAGERTDWTSGLARWEFPPHGEDGLPAYVTVGIRRHL